jgi:hypothetical protein
MEGENPSTDDPRDARHWITVYNQLIGFKDRLLAQVDSELEHLDEGEKAEVQVDVLALTDQLRRYHQRLDFWYGRHWTLEGLIIDNEARTIDHNGVSVSLTGREYQLLHLLLSHPDRVFNVRQLLLEAWHDPLLSPEELRLYISRVRRKLTEIKLGTIVSLPGRGYALRFQNAPGVAAAR